MKSMLAMVTAVMLLAISGSVAAAPAVLAPLLMRSTFRIEGTTTGGSHAIGTCSVVSVPITNNPPWRWNVLVTANHVLADIAADNATLFLRMRQTNGVYIRRAFQIQIRTNSIPLWIRHSEVDVAAMIVSLPKDFMDQGDLVPVEVIAGDAVMEERDINTGDELMCLGYPLGLESNDAGFPILRSGRIASYPVRPSTIAKSFLYDIPVYGGNSGGPVFFDYRNRRIPGKDASTTVDIVGIAGLISQDVSHTVKMEGYFESITRRDPLGLALVIPGEFIKQTIAQLIAQTQK